MPHRDVNRGNGAAIGEVDRTQRCRHASGDGELHFATTGREVAPLLDLNVKPGRQQTTAPDGTKPLTMLAHSQLPLTVTAHKGFCYALNSHSGRDGGKDACEVFHLGAHADICAACYGH